MTVVNNITDENDGKQADKIKDLLKLRELCSFYYYYYIVCSTWEAWKDEVIGLVKMSYWMASKFCDCNMNTAIACC